MRACTKYVRLIHPVGAELQMADHNNIRPTTATADAHPGTATAASLIFAFLELLLAFLFLAGATLCYFTSQLIKFSGLHLPWLHPNGTCSIERRSNLQRILFCDHLCKELCSLSHGFLHRSYIPNTTARELRSPSTSTCFEFNSLSSVERNTLPLASKRRRRLTARQRTHCNCFSRSTHDPSGIKIRSYDEDSSKLSDSLSRAHCPGSRLTIRTGKRKFDGKSIQEISDSCGASDYDGLAGAKALSTRLQMEQSLRVFPNDLVDVHALSQTDEGSGALESLQEVSGKPHSISPSIPAAVKLRSHDDLKKCSSSEGAPQAAGFVDDSLTEPFSQIVDRTKLKAKEQEEKVETSRHKRTLMLEDRTLIEEPVVCDGKVKGLPDELNDNDAVKLKESPDVNREDLNRMYMELEKERIASASAAEEAMSMISKLQNDKAGLQMEALQYQRMAEAKAMFDEQAIAVLQDHLLRREAEKSALEKEIETYRSSLFTHRMETTEQGNARNGDYFSWDIDRNFPLGLEESKSDGHGKQVMTASGFADEDASPLYADPKTLLSHLELPHGNAFASGNGIESQDASMVRHRSGDCLLTSEDAHNGNEVTNLQASHQALLALGWDKFGYERKMGGEFMGAPERQWQHVLDRIWNLEKQICWLKNGHNLIAEEPHEN